MSNKLYICENFISKNVLAIGHSKQTISISDKLAANSNNITFQPPNLVQVAQAEMSDEKTLSDTDKKIAAKATRYYIENLKVQFINNNDYNSYINSDLFKLYRRKLTLHFTLHANYLNNGVTDYINIDVTCPSSDIPSPGESTQIIVTESFPNLKPIGSSVPYSYASLTSLSIDSVSPSVSFTDGSTMTTDIAISILKTTTNFKTELLCGSEITSTQNPYLFSGTFPIDDNTTSLNKGRIFVTRLSVSELSNLQCLYAYQGNLSGESFQSLAEPPSPIHAKNSATLFDIYEWADGTYRTSTKYFNMLAQTADSISSSFASKETCIPSITNNTLTLKPLNVTWDTLSKVAWFDCTLLRFTFTPSNRITEWVPLSKCLLEGIPVTKSDLGVSIELILPDLATLVANDAVLPLSSADFQPGFYPYNPLNIYLEMGYQSDYSSTKGLRAGIYKDTKRARRLFVGTEEVKHIFLGEKTASTLHLALSGIPDRLSGSYYVTAQKDITFKEPIDTIDSDADSGGITINLSADRKTIYYILTTTVPNMTVHANLTIRFK